MAERSVPEAIERIFRDHAEFVYRTAYRVTGKSEDAEDVVQSLFATILHRELKLEEAGLKAYLYRAAVNASLNLVRQRRRLTLVEVTPDMRIHLGHEPRGHAEMNDALRLAL